MSRTRWLILLVLVTFFFLVLGFRSQIADGQIKANQQRIEAIADQRNAAIQARAKIDHDTCLRTHDFLDSFRTLIQQAIDQTKAAPVTPVNTSAQKAKSLATLTSLLGHINPPECGPAP